MSTRVCLAFVVLLLVVVGCQQSQKPQPRPIQQRPVVIDPPAPQPRETIPLVIKRPAPYGGLDTSRLQPARGLQPGRWQTIVVHHSTSAKDSPQSMHRYHLQRGWDGLGYHFVIGNGVNYPDGEVFVGPRWAQQQTGAHCRAGAGKYFGAYRPPNFFNERGIGICLVGNFVNSEPTPRQLASLTALTEYLCAKTGVQPGLVYGHGQVTGKTECPGNRLRLRLADVRRRVAASLVAHEFRGLEDLALDAPAVHAEMTWSDLLPPAIREGSRRALSHGAADAQLHPLLADLLGAHSAVGSRRLALGASAGSAGLAPIDGYGDSQDARPAADLDLGGLTDAGGADDLHELGWTAYDLAIEADDDVTLDDPCACCGPAGFDGLHRDARILGFPFVRFEYPGRQPE